MEEQPLRNQWGREKSLFPLAGHDRKEPGKSQAQLKQMTGQWAAFPLGPVIVPSPVSEGLAPALALGAWALTGWEWDMAASNEDFRNWTWALGGASRQLQSV